MKIEALLQVLKDEFALAAPDVDAALMQWLSDPASVSRQAGLVGTTFERLAQASRLVGLEGAALVLDLLGECTVALAARSGDELSDGLAWLIGWQPPLAAYFEAPADEAASVAICEFVRAGPMAPDAASLRQLATLLRLPPSIAAELQAQEPSGPATLAGLGDEDVSLEVPEDVDPALYDAFLDDAPRQLAVLGDAVRTLAHGRIDRAALQEARRVAHTFKGSGNIIGIRGIGRLAHRIEDVLDHAIDRPGEVPQALARDLEQATACLDQMVYALRGEEAAPNDALGWLRRLGEWVRAIASGTVEAMTSETVLAALDGPAPLRAMQEAKEPAITLPVPPSGDGLAASSADGATPAAPTVQAESVPSLRIGVDRLDTLLRRAGQGLAHHGRIEEHMRLIEERLGQTELTNRRLQDRLRDLELALDRQGTSAQARAQAEGQQLDPLEMDRYNELQKLSRFTAELVADEWEHARAARVEAQHALHSLRKQGQELAEQHRELISARLVSVRQVVARLKRNVTQTAAATGKEVQLLIEGEQVQLDTDVLDRLTEPLLHLLRNAVDHGIEMPGERESAGKPRKGTVRLAFTRESQVVRVACSDDGRGLDLAAIRERAIELGLLDRASEVTPSELTRFILLPGFSTKAQVTEISGRGVGLDVVTDRLRAMKGRIEIGSRAGGGTVFTLGVPATTGLQHALLVEVEGQRYALPSDGIVLALAPGQGAVAVTAAGPVFRHAGREYRFQKLAAWLGLAGSAESTSGAPRPVVLAKVGGGEVAIEVDRIIDSRELILQDIGRLLRRVRGVAGGAFRPDGKLLFLLDLEALESAASTAVRHKASALLRRRMQVERRHALVVDDAVSVRKTLAQLLQDAGYEVTTARDGFDALDALIRRKTDVVLTDLEMPNLDGLGLTRRLRESRLWKELPVMMITSRATHKHLKLAQEAGVDVFLTKPYADDELLAEVRRLVTG